jgi:hypothetical protein
MLTWASGNVLSSANTISAVVNSREVDHGLVDPHESAIKRTEPPL